MKIILNNFIQYLETQHKSTLFWNEKACNFLQILMDLEYFKDNKCSVQEFENNVRLDNLVNLLNNEHYKDKNVAIFNLNFYLNNTPAFNMADKETGFHKVAYEQHNFLVENIKKQMIKYVIHKLIILD